MVVVFGGVKRGKIFKNHYVNISSYTIVRGTLQCAFSYRHRSWKKPEKIKTNEKSPLGGDEMVVNFQRTFSYNKNWNAYREWHYISNSISVYVTFCVYCTKWTQNRMKFFLRRKLFKGSFWFSIQHLVVFNMSLSIFSFFHTHLTPFSSCNLEFQIRKVDLCCFVLFKFSCCYCCSLLWNENLREKNSQVTK